MLIYPIIGRIDSVGPVLENVDIKFLNDGEILIRGKSLMKGYWQDEKLTKKTIIDGWLHTGDVGYIKHGHLYITDRKKDIIVTSSGENIAPQYIEGLLCLHETIAQAMIYGDGKKYIIALLVLQDQENIHADKIQEKLQKAIAYTNNTLVSHEKIKKFHICSETFTIENELLTPSLKLRRHKIKEKYQSQIDALYPV